MNELDELVDIKWGWGVDGVGGRWGGWGMSIIDDHDHNIDNVRGPS